MECLRGFYDRMEELLRAQQAPGVLGWGIVVESALDAQRVYFDAACRGEHYLFSEEEEADLDTFYLTLPPEGQRLMMLLVAPSSLALTCHEDPEEGRKRMVRYVHADMSILGEASVYGEELAALLHRKLRGEHDHP